MYKSSSCISLEATAHASSCSLEDDHPYPNNAFKIVIRAPPKAFIPRASGFMNMPSDGKVKYSFGQYEAYHKKGIFSFFRRAPSHPDAQPLGKRVLESCMKVVRNLATGIYKGCRKSHRKVKRAIAKSGLFKLFSARYATKRKADRARYGNDAEEDDEDFEDYSDDESEDEEYLAMMRAIAARKHMPGRMVERPYDHGAILTTVSDTGELEYAYCFAYLGSHPLATLWRPIGESIILYEAEDKDAVQNGLKPPGYIKSMTLTHNELRAMVVHYVEEEDCYFPDELKPFCHDDESTTLFTLCIWGIDIEAPTKRPPKPVAASRRNAQEEGFSMHETAVRERSALTDCLARLGIPQPPVLAAPAADAAQDTDNDSCFDVECHRRCISLPTETEVKLMAEYFASTNPEEVDIKKMPNAVQPDKKGHYERGMKESALYSTSASKYLSERDSDQATCLEDYFVPEMFAIDAQVDLAVCDEAASLKCQESDISDNSLLEQQFTRDFFKFSLPTILEEPEDLEEESVHDYEAAFESVFSPVNVNSDVLDASQMYIPQNQATPDYPEYDMFIVDEPEDCPHSSDASFCVTGDSDTAIASDSTRAPVETIPLAMEPKEIDRNAERKASEPFKMRMLQRVKSIKNALHRVFSRKHDQTAPTAHPVPMAC